MRVATLAVSLLLAVPSLLAQERSFTSQVNVTAVEVTAEVTDPAGKTPRDLKPSDLIVLEDGVERTVIGVEYLGAPAAAKQPTATPATPQPQQRAPELWSNVIYLDVMLSNQATMQAALKGIRQQAERLTSLGTVEVVVANPAPKRILAPTRDPNAVIAALEQAAKEGPRDALARSRKEFLETMAEATYNVRFSGPAVRGQIAREYTILNEFHARLLSWMARYPRRQPRALLLVSNGFDTDLSEFYAGFPVEAAELAAIRNDMAGKTAKLTDNAARELAAAGWTIFSLGGGTPTPLVFDASSKSAGMGRGGGLGGLPGLLLRPRDPLLQFAEMTGGAVESDPSKFGKTIDRLADRVRITYQVARAADSVVRKVEVKSRREGLVVRAMRYAASTTPEGTSEARGVELLEAGASRGELPLEASLELDGSKDDGSLSVRASLAPIDNVRSQLSSATVRLTIAIAQGENGPAVTHRTLTGQDLTKTNRVAFTVPVRIPKGATAIGVALEELSTGSWGGVTLPLGTATGAKRIVSSAGWAANEVAAAAAYESSKLQWLPWQEGLARAQAEKKLILAYNPNSRCLSCDLFEKDIFPNPTFQRQLAGYITARVDRRATKVEETLNIMDPWGRQRLGWSNIDPASIPTRLRFARDMAPHIIRAGELLNERDAAEAHFLLGFVKLSGNDLKSAREEYVTARRLAEQEKNAELAERSNIQLALVMAKTGQRREALAAIRDAIARPSSPALEAEALVVLGHIHKIAGEEKDAIDAYTRAAARAPKGTSLQRAAAGLAGLETPPGTVVEAGRARVIKPIQIIRPERRVLTGRIPIETLVRDANIVKAVFSLDGKDIVTVDRPPFAATLDFGTEAKPRTVRVQGLARDGRAVSDDTVVLNERHDALDLDIERPLQRDTNGRTRVRFEVNVPVGRRLERIDVFWNESKKGEITTQPYELALDIPADPGYIRGVAVLDDGATDDDTEVMNVGGFAESVDVEVVEMYVRVNDAQGRPLTGLQAQDFSIVDTGKSQQVLRAALQEKPPLLLGVAVDTAPNMAEELLQVKTAAADFLRKVFKSDTRGFLVRFGRETTLIHDTTPNVGSLINEVDRLSISNGRTSMYDALAFALLQFEGAKGKKAVILMSDGSAMGSRYSADDIMALARRNDVAVYAIIIDNQYFGLDASDASLRRDLSTLTEGTGGKAFYAGKNFNLHGVYREIEEHLGNQYHVAFTPVAARKSGEWRRLDLKVSKPDAKVISSGGYLNRR